MRAVVMRRYGGPEVLELVDWPRPEPKPGELLIEVRAAAVNPADGKWRAGMFADLVPITFPHVLGYDVAGVVVAGEGLASGTPVVAMLDHIVKGGYADHVAVPADRVVPLPDAVSMETAAALPTAGLTGLQLVERGIDGREGQRLLLTGAVGAVGRVALHAAKRRGLHVVAAVRAAQGAEALALGADEVIMLDASSAPADVFDHVIDTVGGSDVARLCRGLRPGGRIVTAATTPIDPTGLAAVPEFYAVKPDTDGLARLIEAVAAGDLTVPVARVMPLVEAGEAQRLTDAGGLGGKVVLIP